MTTALFAVVDLLARLYALVAWWALYRCRRQTLARGRYVVGAWNLNDDDLGEVARHHLINPEYAGLRVGEFRCDGWLNGWWYAGAAAYDVAHARLPRRYERRMRRSVRAARQRRALR